MRPSRSNLTLTLALTLASSLFFACGDKDDDTGGAGDTDADTDTDTDTDGTDTDATDTDTDTDTDTSGTDTDTDGTDTDTDGSDTDTDTDTDGTDTDGTDTDGTDTDTDTDTDGGPSVDCETTSWADAKAGGMAHGFMEACVVPVMQPLFQTYDGEKFADFGCATCHTESAWDGDFDMPAQWSINWGEIDYSGPAYTFMSGTVVPEMAGILGYEPYDSETGTGFGCAGCHQP